MGTASNAEREDFALVFSNCARNEIAPSRSIVCRLDQDLSHPTMTDNEVEFITDAIASTASNFREWMNDYHYDTASNEYTLKEGGKEQHWMEDWFKLNTWPIPVTQGPRFSTPADQSIKNRPNLCMLL